MPGDGLPHTSLGYEVDQEPWFRICNTLIRNKVYLPVRSFLYVGKTIHINPIIGQQSGPFLPILLLPHITRCFLSETFLSIHWAKYLHFTW